MQALFDSRDLVIESLPETSLDNASYFGRIFARSGGLTDAVRQALIERGLDKGFEYRPISCDGIEAVPRGAVQGVEERAAQQFHRGHGLRRRLHRRRRLPHPR